MSQLPSEAQVVASIAPKHYGVSASTRYDELIDAGQEKYWDSYKEVHRVSRMKWYIEKGDDLVRARKIEFPFYRIFSPYPSHDLLQVTNSLHECSLDNKPVHPREGKKDPFPLPGRS
jgi:hypothetical protein